MRRLTLVAILAALWICRAEAAQMTVLSSNGVRQAVTELLPQFEKATGHVAVRSGVAKPDISTSESLKRALLAAKSVVISSGPSGVHLLDLMEKQGILATVRPKMKQLPSGQAVGDALARGEGDLGFQQVSELLHAKGITYVGPLPKDVQKVTTFAGGIPKTAKDVTVAREFLTFLKNPRHAAVLKNAGLELP